MLTIDGRMGEGGGQVLRTSLSLSALLGRPFRLEHIRAGRSSPGLKAQHLTSVRAAAAVCGAELTGDELHSQTLEFHPQHKPKGGRYLFDVAKIAAQGSAGSAALVLQTVVWPLLFAAEPSVITVRGGTHVPFSPSFHYLQHITWPHYCLFGIKGILMLHDWGWFPKGDGQIQLELEPLAGRPLEPVDLQPKPTTHVQGLAIATNLPSHISHRMARRADNLLKAAGYTANIATKRQKNNSDGAGLFLWASNQRTGGTGLGRPGYPAQHVAQDAVEDLLTANPSDGLVGEHLADQLLLPMALASGPSKMTVSRWNRHAETNAALLNAWLGTKIVHQDGDVEIIN